ncbi:MAG: YggT family protein [Verrucomicrobia bacterium]|nr:YggT family protein [Verrucomicrobiota bacterium]MCF7708673.1 YggT family protein [Verrucomicrobiota bacterium]
MSIIQQLRALVDLVIKLFELGLFITIILNLFSPPSLYRVQCRLNAFYDFFLNPIRRHIRPFKITPSSPASLDLAPIILLLIVWLLVHPFLMWILGV